MIDVLFNILIALGCMLIGYLLGAFPTAVVIGKVFFGVDPRTQGSGNAGGTNAGRLFGKKVGLVVIIIDMMKTVLPVWICWLVIRFSGLDNPALVGFTLFDHGILYYYLAALGCVLGHCWPVFINFKGGKAVSNLMGVTITTSWLQFLMGFVYFGVLKKTKTVSVTSVVIACVMTVTTWTIGIITMTTGLGQSAIEGTLGTGMFGGNIFLWGWGYCLEMGQGWEYPTVITIMSIILIVRHKENLKRYKAGTERKIKWMK